MRAAFYEIMRKRRAKPIGALPLATFGASLSTCAGLLSLPSAPSIAKLGWGIQNLHEASLEVRSRESNRIQNAIEALRQKLKKFRLQWRREFWLALKYFLLATAMYIFTCPLFCRCMFLVGVHWFGLNILRTTIN